MHTLALHDGTPFPAFGLGTWLGDKDSIVRAVRDAIAIGYRHIDTAWIYFNEEQVGQGIRDAIAAGDVSREDLWVTTKLWNDAHATQDVQPALETSLRSLGLDYVDLYLMHWPVAHRKGVTRPKHVEQFLSLEERPLEATWQAMSALTGSGKAHRVGVSNMSVRKIDRLITAVGFVPAVNQIELHPYNAQVQLVTAMKERGIVVTAYSPLGSNGRPESMRREDEVRLLDDPTVTDIARSRGLTTAQVLIAWALARGTAVIPKSTNPERIRQNFEATQVDLSADEVAMLENLDRGERYVTGAFWCPEGSPYTLESLWG